MKRLYILLVAIIAVASLQAQVLLKDINPGTGQSSPNTFTEFNGKVYFLASDATYTTHFWETDGTTDGTVLVKDVYTMPNISNFSNFRVLNNELYFLATLDANEANEWKGIYKMSAAGVFEQVFETSTGNELLATAEYNGIIYFSRNDPTTNHATLYQLDTSTGIVSEAPIATADNYGMCDWTIQIAIANNKILLYTGRADELDDLGYELYEYNPTTQEFILVKELVEGYVEDGGGIGIGPMEAKLKATNAYVPSNGNVKHLTSYGDKVYFVADMVIGEITPPTAPTVQAVLWESDGTMGNTKVIDATKDLTVNTNYTFSIVDGVIYFEANDGTNGDELWVYNINENSKNMLTSIDMFTVSVQNICTDGSDVYYTGLYGGNDWKTYLFKTDGTSAPVRISSELQYAGPAAVTNGKVVFNASDNTLTGDDRVGYELYVYDPSVANAIGNTPKTNTFSIYPNPTQGLINVDGIESAATYKLYNLAGACVAQGEISNGQINLDAVKGVYMLEISSANATTEVQKIIIK